MSCTDEEATPSWQAANANVAAAAVRAVSAGVLQLESEERSWAVEAVLGVVEIEQSDDHQPISIWSPVVSAASSLPILLRSELEAVDDHESPLRLDSSQRPNASQRELEVKSCGSYLPSTPTAGSRRAK